MPLLLTGKKFHNDLHQNKCLAIFTPLGQKEKNVNINIPPNKENPTIESRKLLRIIFKYLLVALAHQVPHS